MRPDEFVQALAKILTEGTAPGFSETLEAPPGRRPPQWLADLSNWYNELDEPGQTFARDLVQRSVLAGARSVLATLDGTLAFDDLVPGSRLELYYVAAGERVLLNDYDIISLDDELGAQAEAQAEGEPSEDS